MGLNVEVLEKSFNLIAPKGKEITDRFYQNLFSDYPEVKPMFKNDNSMKLLESLVFIVDHLRDLDALTAYLSAMGKRHVNYNVKEDDYPKVGAALLKTFAEFAGDAWTDEVKTAWSDAYGVIQSVMIEGAQEKLQKAA